MKPTETAALERSLAAAADLIGDYYRGLEDRRVAPDADDEVVARPFRGTLTEEGVGLDQTLDDVRRWVAPHAMGIAHPLYLGLINSSPLPAGIVAEAIVGAFNNNAGAWQQGPPFVAAEREALRCLADLLGLDQRCAGLVVPGGSYATLHALQLAREDRLPDWRRGGARSLTGDPVVYTSVGSHFSAQRAAGALGVATDDVVAAPTTGRGVLDVPALRDRVVADRRRGALPFAVVATVGTTGTGAIDPLAELAALCREFGLWLHVDACYGGAGALLPELADRFEGLRQADSVAVDPHKWFFVPMVAGVVFTRHPQLELSTFDVNAPYIPADAGIDGYRRGLPTSRRAAGFAIWMALRAHGIQTIRDAVRRNIALARDLEEQLAGRGFRVMEGGELSIACARWEPAGLDDAELDAVQERIAAAAVASGSTWFATVEHRGRRWLRFALVNLHVRPRHIEHLVDCLERFAKC